MNQKRIGVIGTGRIGTCEAVLTSSNGFETVVIGRSDAGLERCRQALVDSFAELSQDGLMSEEACQAALGRVTITTDYQALAGCTFIFEAALEDLAAKQEIYAKVEAVCPPPTIIASTTSAISADLLAETLQQPQRFLIAHPFQPAHLLPLVELVGSEKTAPEFIVQAKALLEELHREVVILNKSVPGFLINRFAQALFREAIYLIEEGVTTAADIDKAVKYAVGMRYASIGLLEYFDDVGFELEKRIAESIYPDLCGTVEIQTLVNKGIANGENGRTAGKGLYDWSQKDQQDYLRRKSAPYKQAFPHVTE